MRWAERVSERPAPASARVGAAAAGGGGADPQVGRRWRPGSPLATGLAAAGVLASIAVAVATGTSPTGVGLADMAWAVVVGAVVASASLVAGPASRRWMVGGAVLLAALGGASTAVVAVVVLGAAVALARAEPACWSMVTAVALAVLAGGGAGLAHGLPSGVAIAALGPVVVSAWTGLGGVDRQRVRSVARWLLWPLAALVGTAAVLGVVGLVELRAGLRAGDRALAAARQGDVDGATSGFADARDAFDRAAATFEGPWTVPARAVPLLGVHLDAARDVSVGGRGVAEQGQALATVGDLGRLRAPGGVVDLPRVARLADGLADAAVDLRRLSASLESLRSPWLVPPVASTLGHFADEVAAATEEADRAALVAAVAPGLLGADGPRHHLVLVTSPAEARELGGFTASVVELDAVDGDLVLVRNARASALNQDPGPRALTDPTSYPERFLRYEPATHWQDVSGVADFPTAARAAADLWSQQQGVAVDSVLALDPAALAALLALTGPVAVEGRAEPLDADTAEAYLLRDQYLEHPELADRPERIDVLAQVADAVMRRATSGALPSPARLGEVLAPAATEGRLLAWSPDPAAQAMFERLGVDGGFPDRAGADLVSVVHANANPSKIDTFLHRQVRYDVALGDDGTLGATVAVTMRNDAPAGGLPDYVIGSARHDRPPGTNHLLLSVLSPHELVTGSVGGAEVAFERTEEHGVHRYSAFVDVPPGATEVVRLELAGVAPVGPYRLVVAGQPLVHDDAVDVEVAAPPGWVMADPDGLALTDRGTAAATFAGPVDRRLAATPVPDR